MKPLICNSGRCALIAFNKSGIASKYAVIIGASVCDEDYQGEIHINVINVGPHKLPLEAGMKLTQFLLLDVDYQGIEVVPDDELFTSETIRGDGGFGSTGK